MTGGNAVAKIDIDVPIKGEDDDFGAMMFDKCVDIKIFQQLCCDY